MPTVWALEGACCGYGRVHCPPRDFSRFGWIVLICPEGLWELLGSVSEESAFPSRAWCPAVYPVVCHVVILSRKRRGNNHWAFLEVLFLMRDRQYHKAKDSPFKVRAKLNWFELLTQINCYQGHSAKYSWNRDQPFIVQKDVRTCRHGYHPLLAWLHCRAGCTTFPNEG